MNTIIQLQLSGMPVALSTGILMQTEVPVNTTPNLVVRDPELGTVILPVMSPDLSQKDPVQHHAEFLAATPYRRKKMEGWEDNRRSVPFGLLSSARLFWKEAENYTHVLMDNRTRKLIGVREFNEDWSGPVWRRVKECLLIPDSVGRPEPENNDWRHPEVEDLCREYPFYVCLHPCPASPDEPAPVWCFDGLDAVRTVYDGDGCFELPFEVACDNELLFGLT